MTFELSNLSVLDNLKLFVKVLDELQTRGVTRSKNNPTGDFAEWLSERVFNLKLAGVSEKGIDATGKEDGVRYQIKARRSKKPSNSLPLGVIRGIEKKQFDFLLVVVFGNDFSVEWAYKIPHKVVEKFARHSEHVHGVILSLNPDLRNDPEVEDVTGKFRSFSLYNN